MLNAWELLLKAKLLQQNRNNLRCLWVYEARQTKSGRMSSKRYLRRNRSGNVHTKNLWQVIAALDAYPLTKLAAETKTNLTALVEIRDNAVHYFNASPALAKQVLELGTASVRNFVILAKRWFSRDFADISFYLFPLGFVQTGAAASAVPTGPDEAKLVRYLAGLISSSPADPASEFHVAVAVNLVLSPSGSTVTQPFSPTTDPSAPKLVLTEEDIRRLYPWNYRALLEQLRRRYINFSATRAFYAIKKPLMADPAYVRTRYLDPGNPKSGRKDFYSSNILREFDKHYAQR
jgi:hypothetical protein